ncbi:hypothetical protein ADEAN_000779900 [Angomonas deanei]|uniref:Uncharacterized protein n=1 Tax=Angomonas deanei TaxID=59799 RepID=A0A7G2CMW0_9TRYP|nr:hypothetical protein ADEAN_000779900 [Angomonas deanei]
MNAQLNRESEGAEEMEESVKPRTRIASVKVASSVPERSRDNRDNTDTANESKGDLDNDDEDNYYHISKKETLSVEERVRRLNERNKQRLEQCYGTAHQPGMARRPSALVRTKYGSHKAVCSASENRSPERPKELLEPIEEKLSDTEPAHAIGKPKAMSPDRQHHTPTQVRQIPEQEKLEIDLEDD